LHITKSDDIEMDCKACGARNLGDMRHKLASYIVKNPPESASKKGKKQRKAATAQTNGTDENGIPETNMEEIDEAAGSDDDIITQRINKEAAGLKLESTMGDDDWSIDTSEEAVAARMKELSVKASLLGDDEDEDGESKYEQFGQWLEENKEGSDADIIAKAEELGVLGKYKVCQVLVQCIFNENISTQIPKRVKLLRKFVKGEKHQRAVLGGIERLVGLEYQDKLLSKVPIILKKLYDADIVEEDALLKWGEKPSKRYVDKDTSKAVKKSAAPFLDWLQNASEEESDDE
jgi:translation initiation factor 5